MMLTTDALVLEKAPCANAPRSTSGLTVIVGMSTSLVPAMRSVTRVKT